MKNQEEDKKSLIALFYPYPKERKIEKVSIDLNKGFTKRKYKSINEHLRLFDV